MLEKVTVMSAEVPEATGNQKTRAYTAPKLPTGLLALAETPPMVQALGVELASSVPTNTHTMRSLAAVPIDTPV